MKRKIITQKTKKQHIYLSIYLSIYVRAYSSLFSPPLLYLHMRKLRSPSLLLHPINLCLLLFDPLLYLLRTQLYPPLSLSFFSKYKHEESIYTLKHVHTVPGAKKINIKSNNDAYRRLVVKTSQCNATIAIQCTKYKIWNVIYSASRKIHSHIGSLSLCA